MPTQGKNRNRAEGGFSPEEAFWKFGDPELLAAYREKLNAPKFGNRLTTRAKSIAFSETQKAMRRAANSFYKLLQDGVLFARGAVGSPLAPIEEIPAYSWRNLRFGPTGSGTVKGPNNLIIFAVRIFETAKYRKRKRKNLDRIAEAFDKAPAEIQRLHRQHGGTNKTVDYLFRRLKGEIPRSTLEREFRNLRKQRNLAKPEK